MFIETDAINTIKSAGKNKVARWSFDDAKRNDDECLAINRVFNGYFTPDFSPKFKLRKNSSFFAIGSCFAREFETVLLRHGFKVESRISSIEDNNLFKLKSGVSTIYDYFNRYNVPSILKEIEIISSIDNMMDDRGLIYEVSGGVFDDLHYTAAVESSDFEVILARREWVRGRLAEAYKKADVVILTLGLAEAWFDKRENVYLNVLSSPQVARRYNDRLVVKMIGFLETINCMKKAIGILKRDGKKIIITVSPVPLQVTFLNKDIVTANLEAKSILRSVCYEIAREEDDVDYFPSFEMVQFSERDMAWKPDGRHVQMAMVEKITSTALSAFLE